MELVHECDLQFMIFTDVLKVAFEFNRCIVYVQRHVLNFAFAEQDNMYFQKTCGPKIINLVFCQQNEIEEALV